MDFINSDLNQEILQILCQESLQNFQSADKFERKSNLTKFFLLNEGNAPNSGVIYIFCLFKALECHFEQENYINAATVIDISIYYVPNILFYQTLSKRNLREAFEETKLALQPRLSLNKIRCNAND